MTHCWRILDGEYFSQSSRERHQKGCGNSRYEAGYITLKVALDYSWGKKVVPILTNLLPGLKDKYLVLHDIDFALDCAHITTRAILCKHILENKAGKIVDDRHRVGDHCISWRGTQKDGTENIRYKVYNKFIQVLESSEVRMSIGCRMENLVKKEGKFAERIEKYKEHGYTRVELTFYGSSLRSFWEYQDRMNEARDLLKSCKTYECSFEQMWTQRAKCINSMVAVYFPAKKLFAYCHWWNSTTSKKYGYIWTTPAAVVPLLLANYSFNDRPIHYFEAKVDKDGNVATVTKETTYKREPGCTAITLVPGAQKGKYPSREECPDGVRKF